MQDDGQGSSSADARKSLRTQSLTEISALSFARSAAICRTLRQAKKQSGGLCGGRWVGGKLVGSLYTFTAVNALVARGYE